MTEARRRQWLHLLRAEHARRVGTGHAIDYREELLERLNLMGERLRAAPDWREPTAEEQERSRQELNNWFREQGYPIEL